MTHPKENGTREPNPKDNDPNKWLERGRLLFERSVMSCSQIINFIKVLQSEVHHSADEQYRFTMLPTEMIVALYNVRAGIEEALIRLATFGLPPELQDKGKDLFINQSKEDSTDLNLLFKRVVKEDGPKGYLPWTKISVPAELDANDEQYQGTLALLEELADKYHYYDLENVPKAMSDACHKRGDIPNPFASTGTQEDNFNNPQNPQPEDDNGIDPDELKKYQKMAEEVIEDANLIYGQFCAVGSIYLGVVEQ